ncbi:hypothetical protein HGRIS_000718 [Hohenbuehelia grisea]|uniref:Uncharacterized protein n=1 Tax=Hohenbuehelia grisea TaxID=104357 RepID=A0ABR3IPL7_9AGAR
MLCGHPHATNDKIGYHPCDSAASSTSGRYVISFQPYVRLGAESPRSLPCMSYRHVAHPRPRYHQHHWTAGHWVYAGNVFAWDIGYEKTEMMTSSLRLIANGIGCAMGGIFEFYLSSQAGEAVIRLLADLTEWAASGSGILAVLAAEAGDPNVTMLALAETQKLDAVNVGLNSVAAFKGIPH